MRLHINLSYFKSFNGLNHRKNETKMIKQISNSSLFIHLRIQIKKAALLRQPLINNTLPKNLLLTIFTKNFLHCRIIQNLKT
jgi:hypothetical protein